MRTSIAALAFALFMSTTALCVAAEQPVEPAVAMKNYVNELLQVLKDPAYTGEEGKKAQRLKIKQMGRDVFDFVELSRRALARNWNKLDTPQKREFVELFAQLLETTYIGRLQDYQGQEVKILSERQLSQTKAEVKTEIVLSDKSVSIDYRMVLKKGKWRIYDVLAEGVSMVKNYRTQFAEIMRSNDAEGMLKILREKVGDIEEPAASRLVREQKAA